MSLKPPPPPVKSEPGSFAWMDWYKKLYDYLNTAGSVIWTTIDFTGSKLTDIGVRLHSNLQSILGTGAYHISSAEATEVTALLTQTGTGAFVRATSPTLVTPALGTPSALVLTNATGLPATGVTGTALVSTAIGTTVQAYDADLTTWASITPGTGVAAALAANVGTAGAVIVNGGALGTPSSGTVTNLTGTASININGTVGAATPTSGAFTTVSASGKITGGASLGDPLGLSTIRPGYNGLELSPLGRNGTDNNSALLSYDRTASAYTVMQYDALSHSFRVSGTDIALVSSTGLSVTGAISTTTTIKTGGYTVAALPAGTIGMRTYVTDATTPTYNGVLVGGGAIIVPVFYNGTAWVSA